MGVCMDVGVVREQITKYDNIGNQDFQHLTYILKMKEVNALLS